MIEPEEKAPPTREESVLLVDTDRGPQGPEHVAKQLYEIAMGSEADADLFGEQAALKAMEAVLRRYAARVAAHAQVRVYEDTYARNQYR